MEPSENSVYLTPEMEELFVDCGRDPEKTALEIEDALACIRGEKSPTPKKTSVHC